MVERVAFLVLGISCHACAPVIERSVRKLEGVVAVATNYMINTVYVDYDPDRTTAEAVQRRIQDLGYRVVRRPAVPGPMPR